MKKMNGGSTAHLSRSARRQGQPASWMMARRSRDNSNSKMTPVSPLNCTGFCTGATGLLRNLDIVYYEKYFIGQRIVVVMELNIIACNVNKL